MAHFPETQNVKVAASRSQHFDLSHKTITTQDMSVLTPITVKELIPGDNFTVDVNSFIRLAPLPCPTYGDVRLVTRAFYVPYRIIFDAFPKFISNQPYTNEQGVQSTPHIPQISVRALYDCFLDTTHNFVEEVSQGSSYDFKEANGHLYRFTYLGKRLHSLLVSLGYQVWKDTHSKKFSLLPILAYLKIYEDWYFPSHFLYTSGIGAYIKNPQLNITTSAAAYNLLRYIYYYETLEKDYFTTAFLEPNGYDTNAIGFTFSDKQFGLTGGTSSPPQGLIINDGDFHIPFGANISGTIFCYPYPNSYSVRSRHTSCCRRSPQT